MPVRLIARQPLRCSRGGWMVDKGPRPVNTASIPSSWRVGLLKVWDGAAWVPKLNKVWDGAAWVTKPLKFFSSALINTRAPNPPDGAAIVGQTLYATDMGDWTSTPDSYDVDWYDDNGAIGSPTQDSYTIQDSELAQHIYYRVTAHLGVQTATVMSAGTVSVAAIDLSNAITAFTRTSSSGVTPMTWSATLGSNVFEGYTLRAKVYSDSGLSTLLQDVPHLLTNPDLQPGATIDFSGDGLTSIGATDWLQLTVETTSPNGIFYSYTAPAISPTDAFSPTAWNPSDKSASITLSGGNLTATQSGGFPGSGRTVRGISTGKAYWEVTVGSGTQDMVGVADSAAVLSSFWGPAIEGGTPTTDACTYYGFAGQIMYNTGETAAATFTAGDVIGVALDADNKKIWFAKNSTWQNGDPAAGTGGQSISSISTPIYAAFQLGNGHSFTANFGATSFTYTPPTGFTAGP